jgi:hypothetical protein
MMIEVRIEGLTMDEVAEVLCGLSGTGFTTKLYQDGEEKAHFIGFADEIKLEDAMDIVALHLNEPDINAD